MSQIDPVYANNRTLEGKVIDVTPANIREALETAFDYRGDVTIAFKDGTQVIGFVYKFDEPTTQDAQFSVFVAEGKQSNSATFSIQNIRAISFTGDDPAFGKSWDDWMTKSATQREKEAQKIAEEAKKEGYL
jgi:hypothetical protein